MTRIRGVVGVELIAKRKLAPIRVKYVGEARYVYIVGKACRSLQKLS